MNEANLTGQENITTSMKAPTLYSFDIFDTLLTRTTAAPVGIFRLMEDEILTSSLFEQIPPRLRQSFYELRIESERMARKQRMKYQSLNDVTFDAIYDFISKNYGLDSEEINKLKDLEIRTELDNLLPINANIEKLKDLARRGNKVVLISDMYHSSETLRKFLVKFDEVFEDIPIYVSNEYNEGKHSKKLYEIIKEIEGVEYQDWYHFGDNPTADFEAPKELGINAQLLPFEKPLRFESDLLWRYRFSSGMQLLAGASRNTRLFNNGSGNSSPTYELGSSYFTPVLYAYVRFVLQTSLEKGFEELVFIARDGYVLKKIADIVIEHEGLSIATKYFYASRKTLKLPTPENYEIFMEYLFTEFSHLISIAFLSEMLGIETGKISELLHITDMDRLFTEEEKLEAEQTFLTNASLKENILEINAEKVSLLKEYLLQEIDFDKKFAFVELTGSGVSQDILQNIIYTFEDYPITTFFLRGNYREDFGKSNKITYFLTGGGYDYILELFCRNLEGQTVGYAKQNGRVAPVLERVDNTALKNWGYDDYLRALIDYTKYTVAKDNSKFSGIDYLHLFYYVRNYFLFASTKSLADLIGSIPFTALGPEAEGCEFSRKYTEEDLEKQKPLRYSQIFRNIRCPPLSRRRSDEKILKLLDEKNKAVAPQSKPGVQQSKPAAPLHKPEIPPNQPALSSFESKWKFTNVVKKIRDKIAKWES